MARLIKNTSVFSCLNRHISLKRSNLHFDSFIPVIRKARPNER